MPDAYRILVVDDEAALRRTLEVNLTAHGYAVEVVARGEHAVEAVARDHPDLIVLDLGLPQMSGVEVIRSVRAWNPLPIIVLSARDTEGDKVAALDAGADDYVTKPFGIDELLARIRAALRRVDVPSGAEPMIGDERLRVDLLGKRVLLNDIEVRLTPTEWHMVEVLARHQGRLVSHRQLLQEIWGPAYGEESHYLRVYMAQIRRKLEDDPAAPHYFLTEVGRGYRFVLPADGEG
jgi:two-component system KDP operon response regulator KdpE